ncbi:ciliary microtubule inner protein 1 [Anabrus simplex]|uniref:ciliary microtubule inner protein 1 n=1 Tax=Anabrus simplex TaxID=316456 RepID=UPI0035A33A40
MSTEVKPREVTAVTQRRYLADIVKQDGTLKEVINLEEKTRKEWRSKWGFIVEYQEFIEQELRKRGLSYNFLNRKQAEAAHDHFTTKTKVSSSPPFPKTSAGMVGWRSSDLRNSLEIAGPMYVSPVLTIHPPELGAPPNQLTLFVN